MQYPTTYLNYSAAHYRSIDIESRVEGASPQQLVSIMFDELVHAVAVSAIAARKGYKHPHSKRALEIIDALDLSLDHDNGEDIAKSLSIIYKHIKGLIITGDRQLKIEFYDEAQSIINDINKAWTSLS
jgi:flagellar secretion chaperone FliS